MRLDSFVKQHVLYQWMFVEVWCSQEHQNNESGQRGFTRQIVCTSLCNAPLDHVAQSFFGYCSDAQRTIRQLNDSLAMNAAQVIGNFVNEDLFGNRPKYFVLFTSNS